MRALPLEGQVQAYPEAQPRQQPESDPAYLGRTTAVLVAAGVLRAVGSFVPGTAAPAATVQVLYLLTDVCILFGFVGWYATLHRAVGALGFGAFVVGVVGILMIRSSAAFPGVDLYAPGALVFEIGLNALALAAWKTQRLPGWVPTFLLLSAVAGAASYASVDLSWLLVFSGVVFAVGAAGVGLTLRRYNASPGPKQAMHDTVRR